MKDEVDDIDHYRRVSLQVSLEIKQGLCLQNGKSYKRKNDNFRY